MPQTAERAEEAGAEGGRGGGGGEKEKGESTDSTHLLLGVLLLDVILLFSPSMICSSPLSSLSSFCFSPNSSCFLIKNLKIQLSRQSHIYSHITLDPFSDPCLYNISTFFSLSLLAITLFRLYHVHGLTINYYLSITNLRLSPISIHHFIYCYSLGPLHVHCLTTIDPLSGH